MNYMRRISKKIIRDIERHEGVGKIELVVQYTGGIANDVPSVGYSVFNLRGQNIFLNYRQCRGYVRFGSWRARSVVNEVWAYFQSRGVETTVKDELV